MQVWQQQNADAAWEAPPGMQADNGDWGEWPYEGESWRAITGYDGASMMDGVIPEGNVSDDPDTWSPSLSDMEDAAEDVVQGRQHGELQFLRAGGDNRTLQVEALPGSLFSSFEVGESSTRVNSVIVVPTAVSEAYGSIFVNQVQGLVLFDSERFKQLILFLGNYIYSKMQLLTAGYEEPDLSLVLMKEQPVLSMHTFSLQVREKFFIAVVLKFEFGVSCLDKAAVLALKNLLKPATGSWAEAFKYMHLDDDGSLCWAPIDVDQEDSNATWAVGQPSDILAGPSAGPRRPSRPRKSQQAPKVKSSVRY
jgi:hypothetical protein